MFRLVLLAIGVALLIAKQSFAVKSIASISEDEKAQAISVTFGMYDSNNDQSISRAEFDGACNAVYNFLVESGFEEQDADGATVACGAENLNREWLNYDLNQDGSIPPEEYAQGIAKHYLTTPAPHSSESREN